MSPRRFFQNLLILGTLMTLLVTTGCQPEMDPNLLLLDTNTEETQVDDLKRSMQLVSSMRQFKNEEFEERVSGSLNRWASTRLKEEVEWSLDPMAKDLVEQYKSTPAVARLDEISYLNTDAIFLQGCAWSKVTADRMAKDKSLRAFELYRLAADYEVATDSTDDQLPAILSSLNKELDETNALELAKVMRVFDWGVRNIQLLPEPKQDVDPEEMKLYDGESFPEMGIQGVGYVRFVPQVYVYGRGDYAERAKMFISQLRQLNIDAVMLTVDQKVGEESKPHPWCVGVNIGDELYLFDTKLSMPIPNPKTKGIMTLSELKKDPSQLEWMDLSIEESIAENTKYWVRGEDLKSVKAWIYVGPEALSKRMAKLQAGLDAKSEVVAVQPTKIAEKVKKTGVADVQIWPIAFETFVYRQQLRRALNDAASNNRIRDKITWYFSDEAYIDEFSVYRSARSYFFHGYYTVDEDISPYTAIERFFRLMYTDEDIRNLATNSQIQRRHGILKQNQSGREYQETLRSVQAQMRLIGRDTSYFLAQCHFENGSLNVAAGWLDLIKTKSNADRWRDGIYYLLARSWEANGEYDKAIKVYGQNKESSQVHGNLIRSRILKSILPEVEATPDA